MPSTSPREPMRLNKLSAIEVNELSIRTKAMDKEEMQIVLMNLPTRLITEEIVRRTEVVHKKYTDLFDILSAVQEDISLEQMQEVLENCRKALKKD